MDTTRTRRTLFLITIALALPLAACYEHTFTVGAGAPHAPVVYDHWENFWLGGLIGHTRVTVEELCPSGNATIETKQTFLNGLVGGLTSGIYSPTTLKIRCRGGRRAALELDALEVERIVLDPTFTEIVRLELPSQLDAVVASQEAHSRP